MTPTNYRTAKALQPPPEADDRLLLVSTPVEARGTFIGQIEALCERTGHTIDLAGSIEEARSHLAQHAYSHVAIDAQLPRLCGLQLAAELADSETKPRVLLSTDKTGLDLAQRLLNGEPIQALIVVSGDSARSVTRDASPSASDEPFSNSDSLVARGQRAMKPASAARRRTRENLTPSQTEPLAGLCKALAQNEFWVVYQPCWSVSDQQFTVAESLLRWTPSFGKGAPPAIFIPQLEEMDEMPRVGHWALEASCRELARWRRAGLRAKMAINLSPKQFEDDLVEDILATLQHFDLRAGDLQLEVTESVMFKELGRAGEQLQELRKEGAAIALDDFGTGYSSLSYLHRFPVDVVKIDRSFVRDLENSAGARTLVESIIGLGHSLDLEVVAEGVETVGQKQFLVDKGVDHLQGFLCSRPLDPTMAKQCLR